MAYKALIFGMDGVNVLQPYYEQAVQRGILDIVGFAILNDEGIALVDADGKPCVGGGGVNKSLNFELAIISSRNDFYNQMKFLEAQGLPRNQIIDGAVFFKTTNLDFPRLLTEGIAYSSLTSRAFSDFDSEHEIMFTPIYPRIYKWGPITLKLGRKVYIGSCVIDGIGLLSIGQFSSISWQETFKLDVNFEHNYRNVSAFNDYGWPYPIEFHPPKGVCKILIGNDVWIGRGCTLKCVNPEKPLVIGDGAVIAADSVVVKDVPPYAIVGGNPAQIIKYRFPPDVIEAFLRIKWWDWSIEKIHDNFQYFNDVEKFISLHDV